MNATVHTVATTVRGYECGRNGGMHVMHLCNHLQDAADKHASILGMGMRELQAMELAWVLTRLRLELARLPRFSQRLDISTWPTGCNKFHAWRQFLVRDEERILARGASAWVVVRLDKHALARMPQIVHDIVPPAEAPEPLPLGEETRTRERKEAPDTYDGTYDACRELRARHGDLDLNGHVNNAVLCQWLVEPALTLMASRGMELAGLDARFKAELPPDEAALSCLRLETKNTEAELACEHLLRRQGDGKPLVVGRSLWRKE